MIEGLSQAWEVFRKDSRHTTANSLRLVVLVTDGDFNTGGDPKPTIEQMKQDLSIASGVSLRNQPTIW